MSDLIACDVCGKEFHKPGLGPHKARMHGKAASVKPRVRIEKKEITLREAILVMTAKRDALSDVIADMEAML